MVWLSSALYYACLTGVQTANSFVTFPMFYEWYAMHTQLMLATQCCRLTIFLACQMLHLAWKR